MNGFFEELKRRKVYRVAIAYIVAGWALAQGLAQVLPVFEISNSVIRVVIALLLIGFPVALVLAWVFDMTPQGIKATPSGAAGGHRRRNVLMLAAAGVVVSVAAGFFVLPRASARKIDKSIAVLPFENLSDEKENAYFADGVQDDILTNLSKIGDLKVISRTSVMSYRGHTPNVREIGKALGVSTILEGSVRRAGNRVRINVQLIDATTDEHLWASDYDRDLTDVFAIQTDLAQKISEALQAKLSPTEKAQIQNKPTQNGEAYLALIQARNLFMPEDFEKLKQAEQLYDRALQLDPNFALAAASYGQMEAWIYRNFDKSATRMQKGRALVQRALQLQPGLPEAHLALGYWYYYGDLDFDAALKEFEIAQRGLPNDAGAYLAIGAIQRRQGKWSESSASLEKAVSLNPNDTWPMQNLGINYEMQRNFDAANKIFDRALSVDPKALGILELKAKLAVEERGDFSIAEKLLAGVDASNLSADIKNQIAGQRIGMFILLRKFDQAAREAAQLPDDALARFPGALCGKYVSVGLAKRGLGDPAGARQVFENAKRFAEDEVKQTPNDGNSHARLAEALAWLGQKGAAFAEIKRAQELLPETKDAFEGPQITQTMAEIYAIFGDAGGAISVLDGLLQRPSPITVAVLKLNPVWDPIRKDPRFQALLEKYGAKV
jgi:TolB-like protein/cytochrome c-type biogenesis protein CcmH/NrfG